MIFSKIKSNFQALKDGKIDLKQGLISKEDALILFNIRSSKDYLELFLIASEVRDFFKPEIEITSTVHVTNVCSVTPKCKYCGFAAGTSSEGYVEAFKSDDDQIKNSAVEIEKSGIKRVSCSSGHGYGGNEVIRALKAVKSVSNLEVLVNDGADLTEDCITELKENKINTICCNLESTNEKVFNNVKPGEKLKDRINVCKLIKKHGIELSSGLLIGIGETYENRVNHLFFLKELDVEEIPIMGFNPYKNTPMENCPKCSAIEQAKTIAIVRLLFPDIRITSPTPTIGPELSQFALLGGASNIATVIPENHPLNVKGVGSPKTGNLHDVLCLIKELGLKPKLK